MRPTRELPGIFGPSMAANLVPGSNALGHRASVQKMGFSEHNFYMLLSNYLIETSSLKDLKTEAPPL